MELDIEREINRESHYGTPITTPCTLNNHPLSLSNPFHVFLIALQTLRFMATVWHCLSYLLPGWLSPLNQAKIRPKETNSNLLYLSWYMDQKHLESKDQLHAFHLLKFTIHYSVFSSRFNLMQFFGFFSD